MNKLELPKGHKRLLLHSCCAPCSGDIMLRLKESNIDYTIYFYNPNIHPRDCLLYTSPSPRDPKISRMPSSA